MPRILGKRLSALLRAYYRGPDHPMKLRLWGWLRQWTGHPRLTIPYANGGWITVDERDYLQRNVFITGAYEPEVWEALATFATSHEIVWDVGAHIGSFTIRAMLDPRVQEVHAFEPDPIHVKVLTANRTINKGRCTIHPIALGSQRETRVLHHGPRENTGLSSLAAPVSQVRFEVTCQTADALVFERRVTPPTLLKIDAEDWEFYVLQGAKRLLTECPPKAMVVESQCDGSAQILNDPLTQDLRTKGYLLRWIKRPSGALEVRENYLAVYHR